MIILFTVGEDGMFKKLIDKLRAGAGVERDAEPLGSCHAKGGRQVWKAVFVHVELSAFDVASLDFRAGIGIPLAHEYGDDFSGFWIGEGGDAGKIGPFVVFTDVIFGFGVCGEFGQLHGDWV